MQFKFNAIGTTWQIDIYSVPENTDSNTIITAVMDRINNFESVYSRFNSDSFVVQMGKNPGEYILPDDAKDLFDIYYKLYDITEGYFTPIIGDMLIDAGYDSKYSLRQQKDLVSPPELSRATVYDFPRLKINCPVSFDFGAGGKGYLVDIVSRVLESLGVSAYCIDAGGDIKHRNATPIRIGLENPYNFDEVLGTYNLHNRSICGSSTNRRKWEGFNHVMDTKTLKSVESIKSVWVIAQSTLVADCISTCLFFVRPEVLLEHFDFEYLVFNSDGSAFVSDGFDGEVFVNIP
jgi:FAD:protein FMN transferase